MPRLRRVAARGLLGLVRVAGATYRATDRLLVRARGLIGAALISVAASLLGPWPCGLAVFGAFLVADVVGDAVLAARRRP